MTSISRPNVLHYLNAKAHFNYGGCARQKLWYTKATWRNYRADALLQLVGSQVAVVAPHADYVSYLLENYLLTFRGGNRQPWWDEDATLECAFLTHFTSYRPFGIVVLQELDSNLSQYYLDAPSVDVSERLVRDALQRWKDEGRLAKNSPRALATCPRCPVKRQCDLRDRELGETADWPSNYKLG